MELPMDEGRASADHQIKFELKEEQFQTKKVKKWFSRDASSRCFYLPYRKGQPLHIVDEIAPISLGHPSTADEECVLCSGWPYTTSRFVSLHPRLCDTLIIHAYFNLFWPLLFFARPVTATAKIWFWKVVFTPFSSAKSKCNLKTSQHSQSGHTLAKSSERTTFQGILYPLP